MNRVVVDIETIPIDESLIAEENDPELAKSASLNALTGKIVCIGSLFTKNDYEIESGTVLVGVDEKPLLQRFWSLLQGMRVNSFIAHNGLGFDLPFLWRRSVVHGIRPTVPLDLRRYRSDSVFDTMTMWANWDPRSYPSLDSLAGSLGLGSKSGDGGQVARLWREGRHRDIGTYCLHDCWLTYGCFCRLNFRSPALKESVKSEILLLDGKSSADTVYSSAELLAHAL